MASGKFIGEKTLKYSVIIEWESVPNAADNTSILTVRTYITYYRINIRGRESKTWVDGVERIYTTPPISWDGSDKTELVNTRVETIRHNDDGTRSVDLKSEFKFRITSETTGEFIYIKGVSGTAVLDKIEKPSVIASLTENVALDTGGKVSLAVSRNSDAYYHKATFSYEGISSTTDAFKTEVTFTPPEGWLTAMQGTEGTAAVSVQTYTDSTCKTAVGNPAPAQFRVYKAGNAPVLNDGWVSIEYYNNDGAASGLGAFIQGYSRAALTFDLADITCDDAEVALITAEVLGQRLESEPISGAMSPIVTQVLQSAGAVSVRLTVRDTKGRSTAATESFYVHEYAKPTLTDVQVMRCLESGSSYDGGKYFSVYAVANYSSCGGANSVSITVSRSGSTTVNTVQSGVKTVLGGNALLTTKSYTVTITATDALGSSVFVTRRIPTASVVFNLKEGGKGAAFGKYAETDQLLESAWPLKVTGDIEATKNVKAADGVFTGEVTAKSIIAATETSGSDDGKIVGKSVRATKELRSDGNVYAAGGEFSGNVTANAVTANAVTTDTLNGHADILNVTAYTNFNKRVMFSGEAAGGHSYDVPETVSGNIAASAALNTANKWIDGKFIWRQTFKAENVEENTAVEIVGLDGWTSDGNGVIGVFNDAIVTDMHGVFYSSETVGGKTIHNCYPLNMCIDGSTRVYAFVDNQGHIFAKANLPGTFYITVFFTKPKEV